MHRTLSLPGIAKHDAAAWIPASHLPTARQDARKGFVDPILCLIGGCNGAGKTTLAWELLPLLGIRRFLNVDELSRGLSPEISEMARIGLEAGRRATTKMLEFYKRMGIHVTPRMTLAKQPRTDSDTSNESETEKPT